MNAATEARLANLPDPNASPDRWHDVLNIVTAARFARELAEMEEAS